MSERESAKVIPLWNRPSTWGICILILLIVVAVLNGKPKAQATTATIQEPTPVQQPPQPVMTQKPETPVIVKPMPNGDNNGSNVNNNTNKAGGHIINGNGNRVNIITNHYHYHGLPEQKPQTKAKPTPKPQPQECEDHMAEHLAQVAKWEAMFK